MAAPDRAIGSRIERYAWTAFLFISVVIFLFGLIDLPTGAATYGQGEAPTFQGITGTTWQATQTTAAASQIDWLVRSQAIWLMLAGGLSGFISVTGFRRSERWAWFAMALWPIALIAIDLNLFLSLKHATSGVPYPFVSGAFIVLLSVVMLAFTFHRAVRRRN